MGCCNPKDESGKDLPIIIENDSKIKLEVDNSVLVSSHSSMQEPNYNVKYRPKKTIKTNNFATSNSLQNKM
jgi:hypothetical protein